MSGHKLHVQTRNQLGCNAGDERETLEKLERTEWVQKKSDEIGDGKWVGMCNLRSDEFEEERLIDCNSSCEIELGRMWKELRHDFVESASETCRVINSYCKRRSKIIRERKRTTWYRGYPRLVHLERRLDTWNFLLRAWHFSLDACSRIWCVCWPHFPSRRFSLGVGSIRFPLIPARSVPLLFRKLGLRFLLVQLRLRLRHFRPDIVEQAVVSYTHPGRICGMGDHILKDLRLVCRSLWHIGHSRPLAQLRFRH